MEQVRKEEREAQQHSQNLSQGQSMAQEQLRDVLQSPEVIETLSDADIDFTRGQTDKSWISEATEEYLHRDQVLANNTKRQLWERKWLNPNRADQIIMSFPHPESRTDNERVQRVRERIRGDDKEPMSPARRQKIRNVVGEQKTDRESRALDGQYMELLLSQVVTSKQQSEAGNTGSKSLLGGLLE